MPERFSPTKILTYQECPRRYHFQYVLRMARPPTPAMSFGTSLHRALQDVYLAGGPKGQSGEAMVEKLQQHWVDAGFPDQETAEWYREAGSRILRTYHAQAQQEEGQTILLEKRLSAAYKDFTFFGIVDRVDRLPDATMEVIDYKSTHAVARAAEEVDPQHRQQLGLYTYLVEQRLGGAVSFASIHYLMDGSRLRLAMTPAWMTEALNTSYSTARAILTDRDFPPVFGDHCFRCPYQKPCWEKFNREEPAPPLDPG